MVPLPLLPREKDGVENEKGDVDVGDDGASVLKDGLLPLPVGADEGAPPSAPPLGLVKSKRLNSLPDPMREL